MATSTVATIPRFLLPQRGLIWRQLRLAPGSKAPLSLRHASSAPVGGKGGPAKHTVLEKPERFNPPSHGSRAGTKGIPKHFGGTLNYQEQQAQSKRDYPGLMAPEGTWAYWLWTSRGFHLSLTMFILAGMAVSTLVLDFRKNSPYLDMVPPSSDFLWHPIRSTRTLFEILRLTESHNAQVVEEKRRRRVDDVAKRAAYRKAHGLDQTQGLGNLFSPRPKDAPQGLGGLLYRESSNEPDAALPNPEHPPAPAEPRKKWLGVF